MAVAGEGAVYGPNDALATIQAPGTTAFADTTMTAGIKLRHRLEQAADEMEVALPTIVERYRCVGREYMDIANGTLDMARYGGRIKPWDHAAGCLIVAGTQRPATTHARHRSAGEPLAAVSGVNAACGWVIALISRIDCGDRGGAAVFLFTQPCEFPEPHIDIRNT